MSGATTIREKLAKHSEDKTCVVCHRNIDPFGFALETFDPIGRWRTNYSEPKGKSAKVDASGEFPSGETYEDFASFKKVLVNDRRDQFTRNLIEKLLTYTTGRHMARVDQYEIDDILQRVKADNFGLRTMVIEVLTIKIFRSR